jgi:orotidine-5'-phosphate decarboxylase
MGRDAVEPFLAFEDKYAILLALTSNDSAVDFQYTQENGQLLFEKVIKTSLSWKNAERLMYVVGATKAESFLSIRKLVPNSFLLVPGVGAQGGSLVEVAENGMNDQCGILINSSRGIIYASKEYDFADQAANQAKKLQEEMELLLKLKGLI